MNKFKLFLLAVLFLLKFEGLFALPAPAYLSNPYFVTCKSKCPLIDHGAWQELNMDCIWACIDFYESKQDITQFFDRALNSIEADI